MKKALFALALTIAAAAICAQTQAWDKYLGPVIDFLDSKQYQGDSRAYTEADLDVPPKVQDALDRLGLSRFALLRNEIWARHGYVFKTALLDWTFHKATWYRQNTAFGMGSLTGIPANNVDWIKRLEDDWDYRNISAWLNSRPSKVSESPYLSDAFYEIPDSIRISANHLFIKPTGLLRDEIFARAGYAFPDPVLLRLFGGCPWYTPSYANLAEVSKRLSNIARANVELCKLRENLDYLAAVNYSLPTGVTWLPTIDYGAIFVREVSGGADKGAYSLYYSSTDLWTALAFDPAKIGLQKTAVDDLVGPETKAAIRAEKNPIKQLVLFFSNKRYSGYVDKLVFNASDMIIPSYLRDAVTALGIDWYVLLRKEIHARNGAIFADPKIGPIFRACPWYKARYQLSPSSVTRFPAGVKISQTELTNFALVEGADLSRRRSMTDKDPPTVVVDLYGNWYTVDSETITIRNTGDELLVPLLWKATESRPDPYELIQSISDSSGSALDQFIREQEEAFFPGC